MGESPDPASFCNYARRSGWPGHIRQATSEQSAKLLGGQFNLPQYLAEQWPGQIPSGMIRQRCSAPIRVTVEDVAASLAHSLETKPEQQRIHYPETGNR